MNLNLFKKLRSYKLQAKSGFSLVELLIYVALLSGITLVAGASFLSLNQGRATSESRAEVHSVLRAAMNQIRNDFINAGYIQSPSIGSNGSALVFTLNSDTITYVLSGTRIARRINGGSAVLITSPNVNFTAVDFKGTQNTNLPSEQIFATVAVSLTAKYNSSDPNKNYTETMQSSFPAGKLLSILRPSATVAAVPNQQSVYTNTPSVPGTVPEDNLVTCNEIDRSAVNSICEIVQP